MTTESVCRGAQRVKFFQNNLQGRFMRENDSLRFPKPEIAAVKHLSGLNFSIDKDKKKNHNLQAKYKRKQVSRTTQDEPN
jgi:hypothetical protein